MLMQSDETQIEHEFITQFVNKLGLCFSTPEENIFKQGENGIDMYYIQKGECIVNITDERGYDHE